MASLKKWQKQKAVFSASYAAQLPKQPPKFVGQVNNGSQLRECQEIESEKENAKHWLQRACERLEEYQNNSSNAAVLQEAEEAIKTALALKENYSSRKKRRKLLICYAKVHEYANNFEFAANTYSTLLSDYQNKKTFDAVIVACATVLEHLKMYDESIKYFQYATEDPPKGYEEQNILFLLAITYLKQGKKDMFNEALNIAFEKRKDKKNNPDVASWLDNVETWEELGDICYKNGDSFAARNAYAQGVLTTKGKVTARLWAKLADSCMLFQERKDAIEAAVTALGLSPYDMILRGKLLTWDPENWEKVFEEENRVAKVIQANFRGCIIRRTIRAERERIRKLKSMAATEIQRVIARGCQGRKLFQKRLKDVKGTVIQCATRQWLARRILLKLKKIRIRQEAAAKVIQQQYRIHQSRLIVRQLRAELLRKKQDKAACSIQKYCRGFLGRKRALLRRKQILCSQHIQRVFRGMVGRNTVKKIRYSIACARNIQRVIRGYLGRRIFRRRFILPAAVLQGFARGNIVRKGFREYKKKRALRNPLKAKNKSIDWDSLKWRIKSKGFMMSKVNSNQNCLNLPYVACSFENGSTLRGQTAFNYIYQVFDEAKPNAGSKFPIDKVLPDLKGIHSILIHTENSDDITMLANRLRRGNSLYELGLGGNDITKESMYDMCRAIKECSTLRSLHVESNVGMKQFSSILFSDTLFLHYSHLETLNLRNSGIDNRDCRRLASVFLLPHLRSLRLECNKISCDGILPIAMAIQNNDCLEELDLSANRIGDVGSCVLAHSLTSCGLRKLYLQENLITSLGALSMENILFPKVPETCNRVLEIITLQENPINPAISSRIMDKSSTNFSMKWCATMDY